MGYNRGYHSSIKMSPNEAEKPENELTVRIENEKRFAKLQHKKKSKPKFALGDHCRISLNKSRFFRGYSQRYSREVFKVSPLIPRIIILLLVPHPGIIIFAASPSSRDHHLRKRDEPRLLPLIPGLSSQEEG